MANSTAFLRVPGQTIRLERPDQVERNDIALRLSPVEAAWAIESLAVGVRAFDARLRADLTRVLAGVKGSIGRTARLSLAELRAAVADALRAQRLIAFRTSRPMRVVRRVTVSVLGPADDHGTWIEIVLVDEETKEAIPDARYVIETADGRTLEGTTNASGMAREEGIARDRCRIRWPDFPDAGWSCP